ncbi:MAG: alcohol dehydrogenase catalytic domain-containing protein [Planctomycetota bacterium]|jgi:L-iditol 2-dehydrogenase
MQAIVVEKIGSFEIKDLPVPEPGVGEVLVEVAVTGVCRTDLKIIEVGHRDLVLPRIPGEEVVGTVTKVGAGVSEDNLGKRVYIYPGTSCGKCKSCLQGAGNLCRSMQIMGFHRDGGFADFLIAPVDTLIEIPEDVSFEKAVTVEPLSCCMNALELADLKREEKIGIWGGGPAGAFLSRAALAIGAEPTIIEPHPERRAYHSCAVEEAGDTLFDVVIPAVGSNEAYKESIKHLYPRGRFVAFSGLPKDNACQEIDLNEMHYNETTITGAYGCSYRHGVEAMQLLAEGKIKVDDLISHKMKLAELGEALDIVRNKNGMKILLYP